MLKPTAVSTCLALLFIIITATPLTAQTTDAGDDAGRLVAAILGETPLIDDLATLADEIGGRPTGSKANLRAVEWALERFREAGVSVSKEAFTMPKLWLENAARSMVKGEGVSFAPRVAAMPWSPETPAEGLTRRLVDAGSGSEADFARLGSDARDAFILVETPFLTDIAGLFAEYVEAAGVEGRASAAGVAGVVYMGSRPNNMLYRQLASGGPATAVPMLIMERDAAERALRLLRRGVRLNLTVELDIESGPAYESYNVIGEIRGASKADEVVIVGAHLDSWDLGTGALDNGANVAMMIDIGRQMQRLGIRPARTIRLAAWNGEEMGLVGSHAYTMSHADELDGHVIAGSIDIGCGRITGFFTGGRAELIPAVDAALEPVKGLGPFQHINVQILGTDDFDFFLQGVPTFVGNHADATYGPNYHARTDQYHECDPRQLRMNTAIVAALVYGIADGGVDWSRNTRAEIAELIQSSSLETPMRVFKLWEPWVDGRRGRSK